jgi:hypothetical protein
MNNYENEIPNDLIFVSIYDAVQYRRRSSRHTKNKNSTGSTKEEEKTYSQLFALYPVDDLPFHNTQSNNSIKIFEHLDELPNTQSMVIIQSMMIDALRKRRKKNLINPFSFLLFILCTYENFTWNRMI